MKKLYNTILFYGILGLAMGVFYREYTKFSGFEGETFLSFGHVHALALGFLFFLVVLVLEKAFSLSGKKYYKVFYITYNVGLLLVLATMVIRGIMQVNGLEMNGFNHIAGTMHMLFAVGLVLFLMNLKQGIKAAEHAKELVKK